MPQAIYFAPGTINVSGTQCGWARPGNPGTGPDPYAARGGHVNPIHAGRSVQLVAIRWGKSRGVQALSTSPG